MARRGFVLRGGDCRVEREMWGLNGEVGSARQIDRWPSAMKLLATTREPTGSPTCAASLRCCGRRGVCVGEPPDAARGCRAPPAPEERSSAAGRRGEIERHRQTLLQRRRVGNRVRVAPCAARCRLYSHRATCGPSDVG